MLTLHSRARAILCGTSNDQRKACHSHVSYIASSCIVGPKHTPAMTSAHATPDAVRALCDVFPRCTGKARRAKWQHRKPACYIYQRDAAYGMDCDQSIVRAGSGRSWRNVSSFDIPLTPHKHRHVRFFEWASTYNEIWLPSRWIPGVKILDSRDLQNALFRRY